MFLRLISFENNFLAILTLFSQEEYHSLVGMYFRKSDAVILVYDITSSKSFADVKKWKAEIEKYAPSTAIVTLVGSKIDLDKSRVISTKQGLQTAKSIDAMFFEVSAKEDKGVNELFDAINDKILAKRREKGDEIIDDYEIVDSTPENIDLWNSNNQTITPSSSKSIRERCCKG